MKNNNNKPYLFDMIGTQIADEIIKQGEKDRFAGLIEATIGFVEREAVENDSVKEKNSIEQTAKARLATMIIQEAQGNEVGILAELLSKEKNKEKRKEIIDKVLEMAKLPKQRSLYEENLEMINSTFGGRTVVPTQPAFLMSLESALFDKIKKAIKNEEQAPNPQRVEKDITLFEKLLGFKPLDKGETKESIKDGVAKFYTNHFRANSNDQIRNMVATIEEAREMRRDIKEQIETENLGKAEYRANKQPYADRFKEDFKESGLNIASTLAVVGLSPILILLSVLTAIVDALKGLDMGVASGFSKEGR